MRTNVCLRKTISKMANDILTETAKHATPATHAHIQPHVNTCEGRPPPFKYKTKGTRNTGRDGGGGGTGRCEHPWPRWPCCNPHQGERRRCPSSVQDWSCLLRITKEGRTKRKRKLRPKIFTHSLRTRYNVCVHERNTVRVWIQHATMFASGYIHAHTRTKTRTRHIHAHIHAHVHAQIHAQIQARTFSANSLISLTARGAFLLKVLETRIGAENVY